MPSLKRSKPKTVTDRIKTAGSAAGDVGTRAKAAAAAGVAAAGAAGAVAYWKKSQGDEPAVEFDAAAGEPTSVTTTETPEAKAAKESVNGGSS